LTDCVIVRFHASFIAAIETAITRFAGVVGYRLACLASDQFVGSLVR